MISGSGWDLARRQHGLVTSRQVRARGGSTEHVRTRIRAGRWSRIRRGIYVIGAAPLTWRQQVLASCLATDHRAVASHRTAARLWGLVSRSGQIQITVVGQHHLRVERTMVHRSSLLPDLDRTILDAIPVTTVARTILDASAGQDPEVVGLWIDDAIRRLDLDLTELRSCAARLSGPGRRDIRAARWALAERLDDYDPGDSELEVRALRALAKGGLPEPVQQHPVRLPDGSTVRLDLAYPAEQVAIELDGWAFHGQRSSFDSDRARRNALTLLGWDVYQFTSNTSDQALVATVAGALAGRHLRPPIGA